MANHTASSRRRFLQSGVVFVAPLVACVSAATAAPCENDLRLTRLEAEAAIRELHQSWLRQVNSGARTILDSSVRKITAHHAGAPDRIDIAPNGESAVGHFDHSVEFETPLATDATLTQMALVQGTATLSHSEQRTLAINYVRTGDGWNVASVALR